MQDKTEALFRILQEIWFNRSILISLDMKTIEQHCNSALLHQKKEEGTFIHSQDTTLWFTFESALYPIRFPRTKFISSTATSTWVNLYSIDIFELWFSISKYIKEGLDLRFLIKISPNWFIEVRKEITYFILLFISIQLTLLEIMSQIPISPFQRFLKRFWRKSLLFMLLLRYKIDYIKSDWPVSFKTGYSECLQLSFYFLPKI